MDITKWTGDYKTKSDYTDDAAAANFGYIRNTNSTDTLKDTDHYYVKTVEGAKFKLFKGSSLPNDIDASWYYWNDTDKKVEWVTADKATVFTTQKSGAFDTQVRGLEAAKGTTGSAYGLFETEAPSGYNKLTQPVTFTITSTYNDNAQTITIATTGGTVTNGTINLTNRTTNSHPLVTESVENKSGALLPSTGGIGTTIFYVIGGVLVAGAVILLVSRRRRA